MQKLFRIALAAVATAWLAAPAAAGELTVKIADGRATVVARDVPLRQVLDEWARVGNTKIVNGEKLLGGPVTIELIDVPEKDALDILLRSAAGYLTGPRRPGTVGASQYDRVMILATSRPPAQAAMPAPAPFNRAVMRELPPQPPPDDDDGEPQDQGPMPPPGMMEGEHPNAPTPYPPPTPMPGMMPAGMQPPSGDPIMVGPAVQPAQPMTAPRPGMLPAPQPGQPNPYGPLGQPPGVPDPDDR